LTSFRLYERLNRTANGLCRTGRKVKGRFFLPPKYSRYSIDELTGLWD